MKIPKSVFREYDVRGIIGTELTNEFAEHLGRAYGTVAVERLGRTPRLIVGCDNRPSSAGFAASLSKGVMSTGCVVVGVGTVPTPAVYFAVQALGTDGGVMVTGSHNPPEFNGFKFKAPFGGSATPAITNQIEKLVGATPPQRMPIGSC